MKYPNIIDGKDIDERRATEMLASVEEFEPNSKEKKWYGLIRKLPSELKAILLSELLSGNTVDSIQNANWPQNGSTVVYLTSHLKNDISKNSDSVKYRLLNDPHYWYEEVAKIKDGIEYLIIT